MRTQMRGSVSSTRTSSERIGRSLFALYCIDAALDFHSTQDSRNRFQVTLGVFSCVIFVLFVLNARRTKSSLTLLGRVVWAWWVYLAITPAIAYLRGVPANHFLRILLPEVLMGTSMMIGYILLSESKANASLIFKGVFYASICSSIVHLIHGFSMGLSLDEGGYTIPRPFLFVG